MKTIAAWICVSAALVMAGDSVSADPYPSRVVRMMVPYAAGGPTDLAARKLADLLGARLGQPVVVENRGGGGGVSGTEAVATATPDGYTLLVGATGPLVVSPSVRKLRYDVNKDLQPIAEIWRSSQLLASNPKAGLKTFAEFIDHARKIPES